MLNTLCMPRTLIACMTETSLLPLEKAGELAISMTWPDKATSLLIRRATSR